MSDPYLSPEIWEAARRIEVAVRRHVSDLLSGGFRTRLRGQGLQFSEHRVYVPGDDIRHIDWKVTARSREPMTKLFEAERDLSVWILVDATGSMRFGSTEQTKAEAATQAAFLVALAADLERHRVGLVAVTSQGVRVVPARRGRSAVFKVVGEILAAFQPEVATTKAPLTSTPVLPPVQPNLLAGAHRLLRQASGRGLCLILSDFQDESAGSALRNLSFRHEVVALEFWDPKERHLPERGWVDFKNPESGESVWVDLSSQEFRAWHRGWIDQHQASIEKWKREWGVEWISVSTAKDALDEVVGAFTRRGRKRAS